MYQIKIEAHNVAGSSKSEFAFLTLTPDGKRPSHTIVDNGLTKNYLYSNMNIVITLGITVVILFCICCSFGVGYKYSKYSATNLSYIAKFYLDRNNFYCYIVYYNYCLYYYFYVLSIVIKVVWDKIKQN